MGREGREAVEWRGGGSSSQSYRCSGLLLFAREPLKTPTVHEVYTALRTHHQLIRHQVWKGHMNASGLKT